MAKVSKPNPKTAGMEHAKPIEMIDGVLTVPHNPVICYIEGDGIGPDVTSAMIKVVEAAVQKAYRGQRKIFWKKVLAGEEAFKKTGHYLPDDTKEEILDHLIAIKGPLTTPVGGGYRSLNVTMRQEFDLYTCLRPVKHISGVPSPVKKPELLDVAIFRENTEDVYAGIEWPSNTPEAKSVIGFLSKKTTKPIHPESAIGIKPMSPARSKRLMRAAIRYAIKNKRKSVTLVHKGNIMKFTEGGFMQWGYEVAKQEFPNETVTLQEVVNGASPDGRIIIKDVIADNMFQQLLLRPDEYDVIAAPNLNGDYLSDAAAAQAGGMGMAPGGNINFETGMAVFEATHGTAPKYAGQDKVNPLSIILSAEMMLDYIGWKEAARLILPAVEKTIAQKTVTYDLARQMEGAKEVKCSEFTQRIIENMG